MRIALIADTHLSPRAPQCTANWRAIEQDVAAAGVHSTIHLGDLTLSADEHPSEIDFAADLLQDWPTPIRVVPGNHDIGIGSGEGDLRSDRLRHFRRSIGHDSWAFQLDGWWLVGVNAQLLAQGDDAEQSQWDWLDALVARLGRADRVILFSHRPLYRPVQERGEVRGRYVPARSAERLLSGRLGRQVELVVSAHVHQHFRYAGHGMQHLWVPSTAYTLSDRDQPRLGIKTVGWVELDLGNAVLPDRMHSPTGVRQHLADGIGLFPGRRGDLEFSRYVAEEHIQREC